MRSVAFSPDGSLLAAGGGNGKIRIWSMADGRIAKEWAAHKMRIRILVFSPDGSRLASAGEDQTIRLGEGRTRLGFMDHQSGGVKILPPVVFGSKKLGRGGRDNVSS